MTKALVSLAIVAAIALVAAGAGSVAGAQAAVAIWIPYLCLAVLVLGLSWRVVKWSLAPVPFRIPTTCGQERSLPWIKANWLESPPNAAAAAARMALEILAFRSLFRCTRSRLEQGPPRLIYREAKWLWLGALAFHWSLLIILLRHLRLFLDPVPKFVSWLESLDGFFQVGAPVFYLTDGIILIALLYLLQRRLLDSQIRYLSLFTDYFALILLLGIAFTGVCMRYFARTDAVAVKEFALGLATFAPILPQNVGGWFYAHLALVSALGAYLPFSKLLHSGGVFLSPTRNLANNNRRVRHTNPWNYPVKTHTYEEWEEEFHDKLEAAGLPVEKR